MCYNKKKKGVDDIGKRKVAIRVELAPDFDPDEMSATHEEIQFASFKEPEGEDDDDDDDKKEAEGDDDDDEDKKDVQKKNEKKAKKKKAWKVFVLIMPTTEQRVKHFISVNYNAFMDDAHEFLFDHIDTTLFMELKKKKKNFHTCFKLFPPPAPLGPSLVMWVFFFPFFFKN